MPNVACNTKGVETVILVVVEAVKVCVIVLVLIYRVLVEIGVGATVVVVVNEVTVSVLIKVEVRSSSKISLEYTVTSELIARLLVSETGFKLIVEVESKYPRQAQAELKAA